MALDRWMPNRCLSMQDDMLDFICDVALSSDDNDEMSCGVSLGHGHNDVFLLSESVVGTVSGEAGVSGDIRDCLDLSDLSESDWVCPVGDDESESLRIQIDDVIMCSS